jgi:hypothetical protein
VSGTITNVASRIIKPAPMPNTPREAFQGCLRRASISRRSNDSAIKIPAAIKTTGCTKSEGKVSVLLAIKAKIEISVAKNTNNVSQKPIFALRENVRARAFRIYKTAKSTAAAASSSPDKAASQGLRNLSQRILPRYPIGFLTKMGEQFLRSVGLTYTKMLCVRRAPLLFWYL